jgi:hypothetical protein
LGTKIRYFKYVITVGCNVWLKGMVPPHTHPLFSSNKQSKYFSKSLIFAIVITLFLYQKSTYPFG